MCVCLRLFFLMDCNNFGVLMKKLNDGKNAFLIGDENHKLLLFFF